MIYLSGVGNVALLGTRIGLMAVPGCGHVARVGEYRVWAADNGCFAQGDRFELSVYLDWLRKYAEHAPRCLFATAPDVVGDAAATWERSRPALPLIRAIGYPAALVAQDGLTVDAVEWDAFDALFIGGSTAWKIGPGAEALAREARRQGKWVHMGRVNSERRLRLAHSMGCQSADGTCLAFHPKKNLQEILRWTSRVSPQLVLPLDAPR